MSVSADILIRDQWRCVRCGVLINGLQYSVHHRILGNRADNRPSNLILLCGSGTTLCHGWVHANGRDARAYGWIVSKHSRVVPALVPVLYYQPGRAGLHLLDDDYGLMAA